MYTRFRSTPAFDTAQDIVNGLPEYLLAEYSDKLDSHDTEHVRGVLRDISWENLERSGERTYHSSTIAEYEYERPGVRVRLAAKFDSDDSTFRECLCTVTLGNDMEELVSTDVSAVEFHIDDEGVVKPVV